MTSYPLRVYPFRLLPGDNLTESLLKIIKENGLHAAFVISCVGSVRSVHLRYATGQDGREKDEIINENLEVCSLVGTCSKDGVHLHATLGKVDGTTVSGHVLGGMVIQTTAEIVLGEAEGAVFSRTLDSSTGFKELTISQRK